MEHMIAPLKKYADFQGRARRAEYWMFFLLQIIIIVPIAFIAGILQGGSDEPGIGTVLLGIVYLALIIPNIAVTVRRLHDTNRTGFWIFISFLPLVGGIWLFVLTVLDGTPGPNKFGPDPKGRGDTIASTFA